MEPQKPILSLNQSQLNNLCQQDLLLKNKMSSLSEQMGARSNAETVIMECINHYFTQISQFWDDTVTDPKTKKVHLKVNYLPDTRITQAYLFETAITTHKDVAKTQKKNDKSLRDVVSYILEKHFQIKLKEPWTFEKIKTKETYLRNPPKTLRSYFILRWSFTGYRFPELSWKTDNTHLYSQKTHSIITANYLKTFIKYSILGGL